MNSPQIDAGHRTALLRGGLRYAYHQSVDVGVIAVRRADEAACAEAGG